MTSHLTDKEIRQGMIELRNLRHLHTEAKKKIAKQARRINTLKQEVHLLQEQNKEKDEIIAKFSLQLEELRIKVFGKKKLKTKDKNKPKKGKKKSERAPSSYHRPIPEIIDREETHTINTCTTCQSELNKKRTRIFCEEDIPFTSSQRETIKHIVEQGYCEKCKKWVSPIPLPFAKCVLGSGIRRYVTYLSIFQRLSNEQIEQQLKDVHQICISQGEIQKMLYRESDRLRIEYEKLKARILKQKAHHYDETVWKVLFGIFGGYGWIMTGTETREAIFLLGKSRGSGNMKDLNPDPLIGITDGYGVYKNYFTYHQLCWAHLFRTFRDFAKSDVLNEKQKTQCLANYRLVSRIYAKLKQTLLGDFEYEKAFRFFMKKLTELATPHPEDILKIKTIKETLSKNKECYLTCLKFPKEVPPDNNKAERGLRHLVIKRKISYGSKTDKGAETTSILASVLLSMKWMNQDTFFQKYFLEG